MGMGKILYMNTNNVKLSLGIHHWTFSGLCSALKQLTGLEMAWCVFQVLRKIRGRGIIL